MRVSVLQGHLPPRGSSCQAIVRAQQRPHLLPLSSMIYRVSPALLHRSVLRVLQTATLQ